jgi:leader peptidase (prepilin peptidase) / N-methyltransferase
MAPALAPAALIGLLIGSFLNVVAWRVPRQESLVKPRSKCPGCDTQIKAYDNIPVVSWLLLRGKCRTCGVKISARYPVVETVTAALYAGVVAAEHAHTLQLVLGLLLVTFLVPIALIDLDVQRIPDALTAPAAVLGLAAVAIISPSHLPEHLIAAGAAFAFFFFFYYAAPKGMGLGDVKLVTVLGLCLGRAVAPAIFFALILGVIVGVAIMANVGVQKGRKVKVPFGVFLAAGSLIAIFVGTAVLDAYTSTF